MVVCGVWWQGVTEGFPTMYEWGLMNTWKLDLHTVQYVKVRLQAMVE